MKRESDAAAVKVAKDVAGAGAYLWAQRDIGDVILWTTEDDSVGDDGAHAIGRWTLSAEEIAALDEMGIVDDNN